MANLYTVPGTPRRGVLPILGTALIAIVGVGALGQTSQVVQSAVHDTDYPPPYDDSKADRALKAFDEGHPQCELWSDWHKLCSRTGPNGSTYCRIDPSHPVKPSVPFCAHSHRSGSTLYIATHAQTKSRDRFKKYGTDSEYVMDRPFNGSNILSIDHPICATWVLHGEISCSKLSGKLENQCEANKINLKEDDFTFECAEFTHKPPCDNMVTDELYRNRGSNIFTEVPRSKIKNMPVIGIYCK